MAMVKPSRFCEYSINSSYALRVTKWKKVCTGSSSERLTFSSYSSGLSIEDYDIFVKFLSDSDSTHEFRKFYLFSEFAENYLPFMCLRIPSSSSVAEYDCGAYRHLGNVAIFVYKEKNNTMYYVQNFVICSISEQRLVWLCHECGEVFSSSYRLKKHSTNLHSVKGYKKRNAIKRRRHRIGNDDIHVKSRRVDDDLDEVVLDDSEYGNIDDNSDDDDDHVESDNDDDDDESYSVEVHTSDKCIKRLRKSCTKNRLDVSFDFETCPYPNGHQCVCVVGFCITHSCLYPISKEVNDVLSYFLHHYVMKYGYRSYTHTFTSTSAPEYEDYERSQCAFAKYSCAYSTDLIEEFAQLIKKLGGLLQPLNYIVHLVGFNCRSFDTQLLLPYLMKAYGYKQMPFWIEKQGKIMRFSIKNIVISDLLSMNAPMTLQSTCESIFGSDGSDAKIDFDVSKIISAVLSHDLAVMEECAFYCSKDAWLLNRLILNRDILFNEMYRDIIEKLQPDKKLQCPGVVDFFQMSCSIPSVTGVLAGLFIDTDDVPHGDAALFIRKCILGGIVRVGMLGKYCHGSQTYQQLDLKTMYGEVMRQCVFPTGEFKKITSLIADECDDMLKRISQDGENIPLTKFNALYCHFRFRPVEGKECELPTHSPLVCAVEYKTKGPNSIKSTCYTEVFDTGEHFSVSMTIIDAWTLACHGWNVTVDRLRVDEGFCQTGPWRRPYVDYMSHIISASDYLKKTNQPVKRQLTKLLGNALYGRRCQRPIQQQSMLVTEDKLDMMVEEGRSMSSSACRPQVECGDNGESQYYLLKMNLDNPINEIPIQDGACILSWSRNMMATFYQSLDSQRANRVPLCSRVFANYGDTDSIRVPTDQRVLDAMTNAPKSTKFDVDTCQWTSIAFSPEMSDISLVYNLGKKCYWIENESGDKSHSCKGQDKSKLSRTDYDIIACREGSTGTERVTVKKTMNGGHPHLEFIPLRRNLNYTSIIAAVREHKDHQITFGPCLDFSDYRLCGPNPEPLELEWIILKDR